MKKKSQLLRSFAPVLGLLVFVLATLIVFNQLHTSSEASSVIAAQPTGTPDVRATLVAATQTAAADRIARWTPPPLPTLRPLPTATFLPDRGVRASLPQELRFSLPPQVSNAQFSFLPTSADGKTIVGTTGIEGKPTIVAIDIASGTVRLLGEKPGSGLRVSGKYVVWRSDSPRNELSVYDLEQGQLRKLTWNSDFVEDPRVAGNILLFTGIIDQPPNPTATFWVHDLGTQKDFSLGTGGQYPEISGDWVVYRSGSPVELRIINIRTKERIVLGAAPPSSQYGDMRYRLYGIDVPWIAWGAGVLDPDPTLHLYNVETRQTRTVPVPGCVHPLSQRKGGVQEVRISKGVVIFQCHAYMGYHIRRNVFFTIPVQQPKTEDDALMGWVIANDQIIWLWYANVNGQGESRVYKSQIIAAPEPPPYP